MNIFKFTNNPLKTELTISLGDFYSSLDSSRKVGSGTQVSHSYKTNQLGK